MQKYTGQHTHAYTKGRRRERGEGEVNGQKRHGGLKGTVSHFCLKVIKRTKTLATGREPHFPNYCKLHVWIYTFTYANICGY